MQGLTFLNGSSSLRSVTCAYKVGEWCDVSHTMCDARHRGVLRDARHAFCDARHKAVLRDARHALCDVRHRHNICVLRFGLGFAVWFVLFPFCTPFPPLPNKPLSYYHWVSV